MHVAIEGNYCYKSTTSSFWWVWLIILYHKRLRKHIKREERSGSPLLARVTVLQLSVLQRLVTPVLDRQHPSLKVQVKMISNSVWRKGRKLLSTYFQLQSLGWYSVSASSFLPFLKKKLFFPPSLITSCVWIRWELNRVVGNGRDRLLFQFSVLLIIFNEHSHCARLSLRGDTLAQRNM